MARINSASTLVSVVIVNWNGKKWLKNCLASLDAQTHKVLEVIIVDNGSTDGSLGYLKRRRPQVKIVANKTNVGFALGNNQGAQLARGAYILFLNNDTVADPNMVEELVEYAQHHDAGMVQPKIRLLEHPDRLDVVAAQLTIFGFLRYEGLREVDYGQYDSPKQIFSPKGACILMPRGLFNKVGGFDEHFFAYAEETDLAWRVWLAGKKVWYCPDALVYHGVGATSRRLNYQFVQYHAFKNRLASLWANLGLGNLLWRMPLHLGALGGLIILSLLSLRLPQARAILHALSHAVGSIKYLQSKRRHAQALRRVPDRILFPMIQASPDPGQFFGYAINFMRSGAKPLSAIPGILESRTFHRFIRHILEIYHRHLHTPKRIDIESTMWAEQVRDNLIRYLPYLPKGGRALDLGCGKGHNAVLLKLLGYQVEGLDLQVTLGEQLGITAPRWQRELWDELQTRYGIHLYFGDGKHLRYPDHHFDVVLTYAVLEHIEPQSEVLGVLREVARVLKPGGIMLIYDLPSAQSWAEKLADVFGLGSHEHRYTAQQLREIISSSALRSHSIEKYGTFPVHPISAGLLAAFNEALPVWVRLEKLLRKTPLIRYAHFFRAAIYKPSQRKERQ